MPVNLSSLDTLSAAGLSLFNQNARLIRLRLGPGSGVSEEALLPHQLSGEERLSSDYRYVLDCLSPDTHLELKELIGQAVEIGVLLPEGGERLLTGLITQAKQGGTDGGFAHYTLTIEPALAILAHRSNSRVFQDKTIPEIVAAILDEHIRSNPVIGASFKYQTHLQKTYPNRSYTLQYRESDQAFIERLLAEEGISYRYTHGEGEHSQRDEVATGDSDTPLHTLILFDDNQALPANPTDSIRFHRTDGVETADALDQWSGSRQLQPGSTQLASYEYKGVTTHTAQDDTRLQHSDSHQDLASTLEDYDPQGHYYGDGDDINRYTQLRQQAKDLDTKTFTGSGTVRSLVPGTWFALNDHPIHDQDSQEDRQFIVTGHTFSAQNNLSPEGQSTVGGLLASLGTSNTQGSSNEPPYRNQIEAVRRSVPIVPAYSATQHQKPTAGGLTTATVVGPAGEEIYTDELGRIKLQFHWQRTQDHPEGGANLDDQSSTWVRVAYPSAGANWGTQHIPRIGQEVVVSFIEDDIDRPLVTGVVHNGTQTPPTFSGAGSLPANKTLSGTKTQEYKGSRYNELLFDDSTGEIRTKLSSEHGKTQLNQGYLIHPRTEGKGEPRGEGYELRTDEAGALRAAKGLLLSTAARKNATGKQLDREEAVQMMEQCLALFKQLGDYAAQHEGNPIDPEPHQKLNDQIKDWENGSNTQKAGGTATGANASSSSGASATNSQGGTPAIVVTAPGGIHQSTPLNHITYTGKNIDQVAAKHLHQTAGEHFTLNTGKSISLFAQADGLKAIAHHGKLLLQSQHDDTVVNAEQNISMTASQGKITLGAQQEIVAMTAGGAYIKLSGSNIEIGCPATYSEKAASHSRVGGGSLNPTLPTFSEEQAKYRLDIMPDHNSDGAQSAWLGMPYKLYADGAILKEGVFESMGPLYVSHTPSRQEYLLELANGQKYKIPVVDQFSNPTQGELANQGFHKQMGGKAEGATGVSDSARERYSKLVNGEE